MATPGIAARAWGWLFHQPYLLLALTTLAWAGNAVASRLAAGHISPMALTALRWVGVVALLAPFMTRPIRAAAPVLWPIWRRILVMGGLGFTAFNALMYAAAYHTTAVNIAIFQGAVPVFVL
ncbi:MAG: EamA family transporter, partial [Microvirga sp.]